MPLSATAVCSKFSVISSTDGALLGDFICEICSTRACFWPSSICNCCVLASHSGMVFANPIITSTPARIWEICASDDIAADEG